jgi:hypothetical protein
MDICDPPLQGRRVSKARFGLQLPLFDEADGAVGGEAGDL